MSNITIPTLQDFIGLARSNGFARTDRFLVNFFPENPLLMDGNSLMSMVCEEATFPGKNIRVRSLRINTMNEQRAHTADYTGNVISFNFIVDTAWSARYFFENWMAAAITPMSANSPREVGYYRDYIGVVDVYSLIQTEEVTQESPLFGIRLQEAWPTYIHAQPMSNGSQGYHRLRVDFTFKWWENLGYVEEASTSPEDSNTLEKLTEKSKTSPKEGLKNLKTNKKVFQSTDERKKVVVPVLPDTLGTVRNLDIFGGGGGFLGGGGGSTFNN